MSSRRLVLVLTTVAMVVVAVVMMMQRQPSLKGEDLGDRVEITITAPRPVPVTIDGARSGTTPISIRIKGARTRTMKIEGNGVTVEITPDHDQVVNLVKPR